MDNSIVLCFIQLCRLNQIQQELHKQRLDSLRNLMHELSEDDWQYPDPEKLLGLK